MSPQIHAVSCDTITGLCLVPIFVSRHAYTTRWYPRVIQKLVSTYNLPLTFAGGGVFWGSQNSKCQVLSKFQWGGGGVGVNWGSQNPKYQVLASQIVSHILHMWRLMIKCR